MTETSGRWDRHNRLLTVLEGAAYVAGASLISAQTVLPALVSRLGGGNISIGVLGVITWAGVFLPQVFASRYGQALEWKKPWVVKFGVLQRLIILLLAGILFLSDRSHTSVTLVLFLLFFSLNQVLIGLTSPVWFDFFAKLISRNYRGRSVGLRSALAGVMSLGGSFLLTVILRSFEFPTNFAVIFVCAFVFEMISIVLQSSLVEEFPSKVVARPTMRVYVQQLADVIRTNPGFRRFLASSAFSILSTMPLGFFTVFALNRFQLDESAVGFFTLAMVGGQIVGAIAIGYLADRHSNKIALIATAIAIFAASVLALVAPSLAWYRIVFVFLGVNLGSEFMIRYNFAIEFGPAELRSTYIGLMNTLLAPCYCAGLLGGWVSDTLGYEALFLIGAVCSLVGILVLAVAVREPLLPHHVEPSLARPEETVVQE